MNTFSQEFARDIQEMCEHFAEAAKRLDLQDLAYFLALAGTAASDAAADGQEPVNEFAAGGRSLGANRDTERLFGRARPSGQQAQFAGQGNGRVDADHRPVFASELP